MHFKLSRGILIFCSSLFLLQSCRKENIISILNPSVQNKNAVEKFLTLPSNATADLRNISADLRKANNHNGFLPSFIAKYGSPNWSQTVSPRKLFNERDQSDLIANSEQDQAPPIYLIPLSKDNSSDINTFLYCAKTGDSSYQYNVYNAGALETMKIRDNKEFNNGFVMLSIIAAFKNQGDKQKQVRFGGSYSGIAFDNAKMKFVPKSSSAEVASNSINGSKSIIKSDDCWVNEFASFVIELTACTVGITIWYEKNICNPGEIRIRSISFTGGDLGETGNVGGGSNTPGSGFSAGFSGYLPGGSNDQGTGGYNGGTGGYGPDPGMGGPGGPSAPGGLIDFMPSDPSIPWYPAPPTLVGDIPLVDIWDNSDTPLLEDNSFDVSPIVPIPDDQQPITFNFGTDPFPTIANVIPISDFVKFNGDSKACLKLSIKQIAKLGLRDLGSDNRFQPFVEAGGGQVNASETKASIDYIVSKLRVGHAVIVGVHNHPGSGNVDNTTDHFVTIVGCGVFAGKPYFQFYDPATQVVASGTHSNNKLFYNVNTGKIQGTSANAYAAGLTYTVAMVRRNSL